jgi:hypothetical protein
MSSRLPHSFNFQVISNVTGKVLTRFYFDGTGKDFPICKICARRHISAGRTEAIMKQETIEVLLRRYGQGQPEKPKNYLYFHIYKDDIDQSDPDYSLSNDVMKQFEPLL